MSINTLVSVRTCRTIVLAVLLLVGIVSMLACDSGPAWQEKTINGQTYRYREHGIQVKDITTDILGTKGLETEHFVIRYSTKFSPYLDSIISIPENSFVKITHDLQFTKVKSRIPIDYLEWFEFTRTTEVDCGGYVGCPNTDTPTIVVNSSSFTFTCDSASLVTNHELTHYLLKLMRGKDYFRIDEEGRRYGRTNHDFEEALCQTEEPRPWLAEALYLHTPESQYLSIDSINNSTDREYRFQSVFQFRALIKMMTEKWGWKSVLATIPLQVDHPLKEALFLSTGTAYSDLEPMWFAYMDSLKSTADTAVLAAWSRRDFRTYRP